MEAVLTLELSHSHGLLLTLVSIHCHGLVLILQLSHGLVLCQQAPSCAGLAVLLQMEVGKSGESYHFSHTFALESSPVTNLLKLPQHCSAVGSHVKLTFRGCHQEEQPLGPSRLSRQTSSRHFCIKRVRFLGVPAGEHTSPRFPPALDKSGGPTHQKVRA